MIVRIYSARRDCPWAQQLKTLLQENHVEYEEHFPPLSMAEEMVKRYNYPSFPMMWCDEVFVGGWAEGRRWLLSAYR